MFIIKNNYYLYIENTKSINLDFLKKNVKINIIYRNNGSHENYGNLHKFRQKCRLNKFKIYIANDIKLAKYIKADGLYLSSYNKKVYSNLNLTLIGSAHNYREIYQKIKQRCSTIILSRLFETSYKNKKSYFGIIKYNLIVKNYFINLVPLGGIRNKNLLKLNLVDSSGLALYSEIKKKPAISNRLF